MNLLKYIGLLFAQIIVSIVTILSVYIYINQYIEIKSVKIDPISLANTFMVFVTFIVIVATVVITIAGISYTSWFAKQKETILKENLDQVIESLLANQNLKEDILGKIFKEQRVTKLIQEYLNIQTISQKKDFNQEIKDINKKISDEIINLEKKLTTLIKIQNKENKDQKDINDLMQNSSITTKGNTNE